MRAALIAAGVALALSGATLAQTPTPSPMAAHYRAYVAAFNTNDFYTAETEAEQALAAAEATGSNRVGALAFNLAKLRVVHLRKFVEATAPADRALAAGGEGVDPTRAQILVALSRLPARIGGAPEALDQLMATASGAANVDQLFLYEAAQSWGYWALANGREGDAATAYQRGVVAAEAMGDDGVLELALALTGLGSAELLRGRMEQSEAALRRAYVISAPLAPESEGATVPFAEVVFQSARAWFKTLQSKQWSDGQEAPETPKVERNGLPERPRMCAYKVVAEPAIEYPRAAVRKLALGTIIFRYAVREDGAFRNVQIVAAAPANDFAPAVMEAAQQWRLQWTETGSQCRRTSDDMIMQIPFSMERVSTGNSINRTKR